MTQTSIAQAVRILQKGGLVAFPTETVYGLGADASNPIAIAQIFAIKERPKNHPLIVHVADWRQVSEWARDIPKEAKRLAAAFWPGPLTLILNKQSWVPEAVTGGQETVGIRIPRHPIAQALLQAFGGGIAAPSANKFTHISPTTAAAVMEELGSQWGVILDGGECEIGLESTIVDLSEGRGARVLRPGMITAEQISAVLGKTVAFTQTNTIRAPGMHELHYAPSTRTRLIAGDQLADYLTQLSEENLPVIVIVYSPLTRVKKKGVKYITIPRDVHAYAHQLYHLLRYADHQQAKQIIVEQVPDGPDWEAIRDRLQKASAR